MDIASDNFFRSQCQRLAFLTARHALPAIAAYREFATDGGLASYGASLMDATRQVAGYMARILKGEKPADLPVVQSTKVEFRINMNTAKALGVTCPPGLLAIADEVIE